MNVQMSGTCGGAVRTQVSALPGRVPDLRQELEKALISPYGLHLTAESCAKSWDDCPWSDAELRRQIGVATVWLSRCEPTRGINMSVGTTYGLKHLAADWWRAARGGNGYSLNGMFCAAAHRLGLKMTVPPSYGQGRRDFFNPYLNISSRSVERLRRETATMEMMKH